MSDIIIGIDLGTTYSCFGIYKDGKVEIIANEMGNRTIPSYVSFTSEERYIGETAKNMAGQNPKNTVYDVKRLIGRKYSDEKLQNDLEHLTFNVKKADNGNPLIEVEYLDEIKEFYPEQISAMILEKIKLLAEKYIGSPITKAVVTVPAYFNDSQRQSTKDAGTIAGLEIVRIINEPTAAALAYGLNDTSTKNILVYDLGGGTLDVTILTIDNGIFEVKSTAGDTHLGGEDFDFVMKEYLFLTFAEKNILKTRTLTDDDKKLLCEMYKLNTIDEFKFKQKMPQIHQSFEQNNLTNSVKKYISALEEFYLLKSNPKSMRKLLSNCEIAKKTLSTTNTATINVENFYNTLDLNTTITRQKFEDICKETFEKAFEPVKRALVDAKFSERDINDVVLVGGSTRIPAIQQMLEEKFPGKLKFNINPDEAVAYGAAIQGAMLSGIDKKLDALVLLDVTPLSLGIETAGGVMAKMIKRNTPIPISKEEIFSTFSDNQPGVTVKVYEGERELTKDNNLLGTFQLTGIPPMPKGTARIKVTFSVDVNGIMSVKAIEESSGKENNIVIENRKDRLSTTDIDKMISNANLYAEIDKLSKEKIEAKNSLDNYTANIMRTINNEELKNKLGEELYENIFNKVNDVISWLEDIEGNDITVEIFKNKYSELESIVLPILKKFIS
jgi:L1 cell adhesion molecule like protein